MSGLVRLSRSLITLLVTLCLAAAPSTALAQSAGDEQYQDPFGAETQTGSSSQEEQPTTPPEDDGTLTDEPQTGSQGETAPPITEDDINGTTGLDDVPQDTANRPQRLADTGIDTRLFLVLGASLLVAGIGLRLRTIPERF